MLILTTLSFQNLTHGEATHRSLSLLSYTRLRESPTSITVLFQNNFNPASCFSLTLAPWTILLTFPALRGLIVSPLLHLPSQLFYFPCSHAICNYSIVKEFCHLTNDNPPSFTVPFFLTFHPTFVIASITSTTYQIFNPLEVLFSSHLHIISPPAHLMINNISRPPTFFISNLAAFSQQHPFKLSTTSTCYRVFNRVNNLSQRGIRDDISSLSHRTQPTVTHSNTHPNGPPERLLVSIISN